METRHKVLLVDDDPDLLEVYRETIAMLPSQPEIHTAPSGARAMAMLEKDTYRIVVSDLKMPKMDGLQLLSIIRRKYPELRTVVLTSLVDEQFRSRVYSLGVDLYWHKPASEQEMAQFLECMESLLGREYEGGFRGVQSKSLVDLIQLECISQSSTVLRITNGPFVGRIWINNGEVVDSETEEARGEDAFKKILRWKAGNFEFLPAEQHRPRTIFNSYNALLLESAQAIDELDQAHTSIIHSPGQAPQSGSTGLSALVQMDDVEFALKTVAETRIDSRGLENPEHIASWVFESLNRFRDLGESLQAGALDQITGIGLQRNIAVAQKGGTNLCVGWKTTLDSSEIRERMKKSSHYGLPDKIFSPSRPLLQLHSGSFSMDRCGNILATTLPSTFPRTLIEEIGGCVVETFRGAQIAQLPLNELIIHYPGIKITAREMRGGAIIFLSTPNSSAPTPKTS